MDIFKVCLSQKPHRDIPSSAMRGILSNSITEKQISIKKNQVEKFVDLVGQKGFPFCPSTFAEKHCRVDTFEQTQLFVLTFDYRSNFNKTHNPNLAYADISAKAALYHLPIFFAYTIPSTFDLTPDDRVFCIVFRNEYPICDYREAETLLKALLTIFPEANRTNSRVTDLYFGGNEILHFGKSLPTINPDLVFMNLYSYLRMRYGENNFKRKIEEFAEETGIILNGGKPYITFFSNESAEELINISDKFIEEESREGSPQFEDKKKSPKPIMYKNGFGENFSRLIYSINFLNGDHQITFDQSSATVKSSKHQLYRSETIRSIRLSCKLYQDFESDRHIESLAFRELLGIATNLVFVESGPRTFRRILGSKSYNIEKTSSLWKHYFRYLKGRKPYPCNSFCPYHMICSHGENILSTCKLRPGQIERISGYELPLVELEEAIKDFKEKFQIAVMSSDNVWHVIKSQTALGKTETILRWIKDHPEMKVLIVVPTNKLKREIQKRAKEMGIDLLVSPSLHEILDELPEDLREEIEARLDIGRSPMVPIKKAIAKQSKKQADQDCAKLLNKYIAERDMFYASDNCAVTTHRRLESIDLSKYDLVVIDEDYIFSTVLTDRSTITVSDLNKLDKKLGRIDKNSLLRNKVKKVLKKAEQRDFFELGAIEYDRAYETIKLDVDLRALCEATHFCFREKSEHNCACVTFTKKPRLPENVKYIMLSATARKDICEYCFGAENVKFYDCKEAELEGKENQYYQESMSRSYLDEHLDKLEKIKNWSGFDHTITFKKYDKYCTDGMYYGNCVGCDVLKGENIDVIGTPHQPDWIYKLFAFMLGFDVYADLKPHTIVEHNGYRFAFTTFEDEILRAIQFYVIETDLEQAVGRARLLRCDCTVNLFSDFPLKQAMLRESEYDTNSKPTGNMESVDV